MTEHTQTDRHACFGTSRDPIDYEKLVKFLQGGYDQGERDANLKISMVGQICNDVLDARKQLEAVRALATELESTGDAMNIAEACSIRMALGEADD